MALQKESVEQRIDFDSLCLQVGTRLQLEVVRDVKPIQVISSLIGYAYGEYLIVRMPDSRSDPIAFRVGEKITIRLFSGVKVCAFDVTVQRLFDAPLLYMHVSFPQSIRGANLRSAMRVKTTVPSSLRTAAAELQVALRNLSVKGALIEAPQKCGEVGEKVHLSFAVPCMGKEGGEVIKVEAFVRNVSVSSDRAESKAESAAYLCGVEFGSLSQLHQLVLQNFTYEAAFSQRQSIV